MDIYADYHTDIHKDIHTYLHTDIGVLSHLRTRISARLGWEVENPANQEVHEARDHLKICTFENIPPKQHRI